MPVDSIVVTGAALYGTAAIIHKNFSPVSRVERMSKNVEEADGLYEEAIRKAPNTEEGRDQVSHSQVKRVNLYR